jgi:voltage-gated sodium channel
MVQAASVPENTSVNPVQAFARRIVCSRSFEPFMVGLILFNALLIGLETFPEIMARFEPALHLGNNVILGIFII